MKPFIYRTRTSVYKFELERQPALPEIQEALFALYGEKNSQAKIYWENPNNAVRFRLVLTESDNEEIICQLDLCVDGSYLPVWTSYETDLTKLCQTLEISSSETEKLLGRDGTPFVDASERKPMTFSGVESCFVSERQDSPLENIIAFKMLLDNKADGASMAQSTLCSN